MGQKSGGKATEHSVEIAKNRHLYGYYGVLLEGTQLKEHSSGESFEG